MALLERESQVADLTSRLAEAAAGRGGLVFLGGEAGTGKTALVSHFLDAAGIGERVLIGFCDAVGTARPLGPLLDMAPSVGPEFAARLAGGSRADVFSDFLAALGSRLDPDVVVFEDVHWADDATLDLLRFLGRRLATRRALLIASYRYCDAGQERLQVLLGDLATVESAHRLTVSPLSLRAVTAMCAGSGLDPTRLYELTGGNPFFVTEVIGGGGQGVPSTVKDAVLARVARLSLPARAALEGAAAIGPTISPPLLSGVVGPGSGIDECLDAGILIRSGELFAFRHELVRLAIEEATPRVRRAPLHATILALMRSTHKGRWGLSALVRHAEAAGDAAAVLELAPAAAEQAAELLAHREAVAHYRLALRFAETTESSFRAGLLERFAHECQLSGELVPALEARREAAALWAEIGDRLRNGDNLASASRLSHLLGRREEADQLGEEAIRTLEQLIPGPELAMAYNNAAWVRMLACDLAASVDMGRRAETLAQRLGDHGTALHASITVSAAEFQRGHEGGRLTLESTWTTAREAGLEEQAARSVWNLALLSLWQRRYGLADHYIEMGSVYCQDHDLESWCLLLRAARARWLLERGRWNEAEDAAVETLGHNDPVALSRIMALVVLGRIRARRGNAGAGDLLGEALQLATQCQWMGPFAPVRPARAEAAWLAGDADTAAAEARAGHEDAQRMSDPWQAGELAFWAMRTGDRVELGQAPAEPYALDLAGDWAAAAGAWRKLGCPFEMALSLSLATDESALLESLAVFDGLGALPAAAELRRRLRERGAVSVPRGPRPSTREHPAGLTTRECEVLALVATGHGNRAIASRLFLSEKTVEHHVAALLHKLSASSRSEAVVQAQRLGLVPQIGGQSLPN